MAPSRKVSISAREMIPFGDGAARAGVALEKAARGRKANTSKVRQHLLRYDWDKWLFFPIRGPLITGTAILL